MAKFYFDTLRRIVKNYFGKHLRFKWSTKYTLVKAMVLVILNTFIMHS